MLKLYFKALLLISLSAIPELTFANAAAVLSTWRAFSGPSHHNHQLPEDLYKLGFVEPTYNYQADDHIPVIFGLLNYSGHDCGAEGPFTYKVEDSAHCQMAKKEAYFSRDGLIYNWVSCQKGYNQPITVTIFFRDQKHSFTYRNHLKPDNTSKE